MPALWLISDARNDAALEGALRRLPCGSGFVFRHYHLPARDRRARFRHLDRIARKRGIMVALAGDARLARRWGAQAVYGGSLRQVDGLAVIATVHSLRELGRAQSLGADLVMLSPVYPTRSHPGAGVLGPVRAQLIAAKAHVPVVMLGGMTARRARHMRDVGWAAIDGLSTHWSTR